MTLPRMIFYVDNEVAPRTARAGVLWVEDYHLAFATTGAEALMQVAAIVPALILLDLMMPGPDPFCCQIDAQWRSTGCRIYEILYRTVGQRAGALVCMLPSGTRRGVGGAASFPVLACGMGQDRTAHRYKPLSDGEGVWYGI